MLIVLVTGSRDLDQAGMESIASELKRLEPDMIVHGGATGADDCADRWAARNEIPCIRVPAQWLKEGNSAGPTRNKRMCDLVAWFARKRMAYVEVHAWPRGESKGTRHCIQYANSIGLRVVVHEAAETKVK